MLKKLYPKKAVDSVYELDLNFYRENNIKGVIFDIDNTLVTHTTLKPPVELLSYFEALTKEGIKIAIVSNNKKARVEAFCRELGFPCYWRAFKPQKKYLEKSRREFGLLSCEVCLVGDQIFTDIYGANRMGFYSVLVTALGENETGFVAFKRIFENLVIKKYNKNKNQTT